MLPVFLAPFTAALRPFALPGICAAAALVAGVYVLDLRADLALATTANTALTAQLQTAATFNERLAASVQSQAQSAERFGRQSAGVSAALAETLESLSLEPRSIQCLESPATRLGLDGLRAQRAAHANAMPPNRAGDSSPTP